MDEYKSKFISKKIMMDNSDFYVKEMQNGKIFIFPTDTIYGIGCNAQNVNSIKRIRGIKRRNKKPFAIIPPSYSWLTGNCNLNKLFEEKYSTAINGKLTLITNLKNKKAIAKKEIIPSNKNNTIAIRIMLQRHWFMGFIRNAKTPFIATSVNFSGDEHIKEIDELSPEIISQVDYIIVDGVLNNEASTIIDVTGDEEKIIDRERKNNPILKFLKSIMN